MNTIAVPSDVLEGTFEQLRMCGEGRLECVTYWCGPIDDSDSVTRFVHPVHISGTFGYEVDSAWVNEFFLELRRVQESVRVQIHTHPREASHSATDDEFAIAPATGFLSLVLPDFALGHVGLHRAHLVEMRPDGSWAERDAERSIVIR